MTEHQRVAEFRHHLHDEWLQDPESTRRFKLLNRRRVSDNTAKRGGETAPALRDFKSAAG